MDLEFIYKDFFTGGVKYGKPHGKGDFMQGEIYFGGSAVTYGYVYRIKGP